MARCCRICITKSFSCFLCQLHTVGAPGPAVSNRVLGILNRRARPERISLESRRLVERARMDFTVLLFQNPDTFSPNPRFISIL